MKKNTASNKIKSYIFILTITILVILSSFIVSIELDDSIFFARSGSIITLLGVIMEYRRIMFTDKNNHYVSGNQISLSQTRKLFDVSCEDKKIRLISNIIVIIGTIIWGYGDLLIQYLLQ